MKEKSWIILNLFQTNYFYFVNFVAVYGGPAAGPSPVQYNAGQYNAPAGRVYQASGPSYTGPQASFSKPAFQPQNYQQQQLVGAYWNSE